MRLNLSYQSIYIVLGLSLTLVGCGTYVPEIQEHPFPSTEGQRLVQAIAQNVNCEVQNAFYDVINNDKKDFERGDIPFRQTSWLDSWGVQTTLNLTTDETGAINPTVSWLPPSPASALFNLNAGVTASSDAMRIDKVGSYYSVKELIAAGRCAPDSRPGGLFLMQSDLKLKEWLLYNVTLNGTKAVAFPNKSDGPLKQDVISHEVKFIVLTSGNLTPGFKLTRVLINQSGSLLSASRTRTHDLLITIGPMSDPKPAIGAGKAKRGPSLEASNAHLASEIGVAVSNNLQPNLLLSIR